MFVDLLAETVHRFGLEIHAYCLMPNHYHLLVRSPNSQLSRAMKHIGQVYTQRFNRRHGRDGPLFRGRFHSILVDSDRYLDTVARYIHLNPLPKTSTDRSALDDFTWSSFNAYAGRGQTPDWLETRHVLARFPTALAYFLFVRTSTPNESVRSFYEDPFTQRQALGDQRFTDRCTRLAGRSTRGPRPGFGPRRPD